jgi:hypothetical protein
MSAATWFWIGACAGVIACGGSSREPLPGAPVGQGGEAAAQSGAGGGGGVPGAAAAGAGGSATGGVGAGGGIAGAASGGGGAASVPTHAQQLAAIGPYCAALATICPNFETTRCTNDGATQLPQQGEACYAEQVLRNMCTLLLPAEELECASVSSGGPKTGFCTAEQAAVLACLGQ